MQYQARSTDAEFDTPFALRHKMNKEREEKSVNTDECKSGFCTHGHLCDFVPNHLDVRSTLTAEIDTAYLMVNQSLVESLSVLCKYDGVL